MKKTYLFLAVLGLLVLSVAIPAYSWQGRMAGMGNPFGLVMDESDLLIHPSGIANGKGLAFYGDYGFHWLDATDWDYTIKQFNSATGVYANRFRFRTSGDEMQHDVRVGAALPLGAGRLGLFFEYANRNGDFNGHELLRNLYNKYNFDDSLDAFALRVLYGLPIGAFKVGGEVQLQYGMAKNSDTFFNGSAQVFLNDIIGSHIPSLNTFPFQFPYDSKWWEMLFKGSLEGPVGPGKLSATIRGGFIFSGDNELQYWNVFPLVPFILEGIDFKGGVEGWKIGGDLWWRTPLGNGLSLPLLLRVDYDEKTWNGKGVGIGVISNIPVRYGSSEKNFQVEVGGGLDKEFGKGARAAIGLYYNYLDGNRSFFYQFPFQKTDHTDYPHHTEHRGILKVAGEKEFCPVFTARLGLNVFFGWVNEGYKFRETFLPAGGFMEHIFIDGWNWGALVSLGGTVKLSRFSLEPFISAGYQKLGLNGDNGFRSTNLVLSMEKLKEVWSVGAGFSIKF